MKQKRAIEELLPVALGLCEALGPCCTRIAVAGSIRRGEPEVGDIEIVCCPTGEALDVLLNDWLRLRKIEQRRKGNGDLLAWGPRYKAFVFTSPPGPLSKDGEGERAAVPVDLFMVLGDRQWGPTYLIRTGPGEANDSLVTTVRRKNQFGRWGVLPEGLVFRDGAVWKGGEKLDTPEERDVFEACGLPYVPPPLRGYATYQALRWGRGMRVYPPEWADGRDDYFIKGERRVMQVQVAGPVAESGPLEQGKLF